MAPDGYPQWVISYAAPPATGDAPADAAVSDAAAPLSAD